MKLLFSPEQDQYLQLAQTRAYYEGMREGLRMYSHWRDGIEYVGTNGKPLKEAIADINQQEELLLQKYNTLLRI